MINPGKAIANGIKAIVDTRRSQGRPVNWEAIQAEVEVMANREVMRPVDVPPCPACSNPPFLNIYPNFHFAHRSSTPECKKFVFWGCPHAQKIKPQFSMMTEQDLDIFEAQWREMVPVIFEQATSHYTEEQKRERAKALEINYAPVVNL